ncbi:MAG: YHS domain-containing (seleno)protein [Pseudomonadota bacterium]
MPISRRTVFSRFLGLAAAIALLVPAPALALDKINPTGPNHLAVRGTDTTSYFTKGKPLSGSTSHTVRWKGATWRFGSPAEATKFRANPTAYAPQFGAYCTGGLAGRHVVEGKPQHYRLHGGKLYLFHTSAGARRFSGDPSGTIRKAKAYWRELGME